MRPNRFARPLTGLLAAGLIALLGGGIITSHALTPTPSPLPLPLPEVTPTLPPPEITPTLLPTLPPPPPPTATPYGLPPGVGEAPFISFGETVEGELTTEQPSKYYQFQAEAGELVIFEIIVAQPLPQIILDRNAGPEYINERLPIAPDGTVILTMTRVIQQTGVQLLSLEFTGSFGAPQPYTLRRIKPEITTLNYGNADEGTLIEAQSVAAYRFEGAAGDVINLTASASFPSRLTLYYSTSDPFNSGEMISSDGYHSSSKLTSIEPYRLPYDGTYYAVMRRQYAPDMILSLIDNRFNLRLSRVEAVPLSYGALVDGELTADAPVAYYSFTPQVGDVINARVTTDGRLDTALAILGPELGEVFSDDDSGPGLDPEIFRYGVTQYIPEGARPEVVYLLKVRGSSSNQFGSFQLSLNLAASNALSESPTIWRWANKSQSNLYYIESAKPDTFTLRARLLSGAVMPQILAFQDGQTLLTLNAPTVTETTATLFVPQAGRVLVQLDSLGRYAEVELSVTRGMDESE